MTASGYQHLNIEDRKIIASCLNNDGVTLKQIALSVNHSPKCIREEITCHCIIKVRANQRNKCGRQEVCVHQRLCTHCLSGFCKSCSHDNCNELCEDFIPTPLCPRTDRFPFVCSGCRNIDKCKLPKYFYIAERAQAEYEISKRKWRTGLNYHSPYEIARMLLNEKVLELNRLHYIDPSSVDLTPILH